MSHIFISYSREDRDKAQTIAAALEAEGYNVWWDGVLRAGDAYDEEIEENLRTAGAVVVLWSASSTKSKWVRAEATIGERHSNLVPVDIEACDRPLRFELIQSSDLTSWNGDRDASHWKNFVASISKVVERSPSNSSIAEAEQSSEEETLESALWAAIENTDSPADLDVYLKRFSNGRFRDLAHRKRRALLETDATAKSSEISKEEGAKIPSQLIAIAIYMVATMVGMATLVIANALHIGWFSWTPVAGGELLETGEKEVGFIFALNWSFAALFLMPAAMTVMFLALNETKEVVREMVRRRMLVAENFSPITMEHGGLKTMQRHIGAFVIGGMATATLLTMVLAMSDHAQVAGQFYGDPAEAAKLDRIDSEGYALEAPNIERDWMVASLLSTAEPETPKTGSNSAFGLVAYIIYVGLSMGLLLSFGLVILGMGAVFLQGILRAYGLRIIPALNSNDPRCGAEIVSRFFSYVFILAFLGCAMCYFMGIQNIYLRSPDPDIFALLAPSFSALTSADGISEKIDAVFGFFFSGDVAKGTRNIYVWIFGFLIFTIFIGGFVLFLRQGTMQGRAVVLEQIRANSFERLKHLTTKEEGDVKAQLLAQQFWPHDQLTMKKCLIVIGLLMSSFVFYKLGVIIILVLGAFLAITLWRTSDAPFSTIEDK